MVLEQLKKQALACGLPLFVVAGLAFGQTQVLVEDGFGDGDRDNDGTLEGINADSSDVGVPWYFFDGFLDTTASIADDTVGIGNGNALDVTMMIDSPRGFLTSFAQPVDLANDGDRLRVVLTARVTESPIDVTDGSTYPTRNGDRRFRVGFYNNNGTPEPSADFPAPTPPDTGPTDDDTGYLLVVDVDTPAGNTLSIFGDKADGILGGSSVSLGATSTNTAFGIQNDAVNVELSLVRTGDTITASAFIDGQLDQSGSASTADIAAENLPFSFDYVAFGTCCVSLDYRVDDILVEFIPAPTGPVTTDGFEDNDWNNDGAQDTFPNDSAMINDADDRGFNWVRGTGVGSFDVFTVDDSSGIGTGNAANLFSFTSSTRAIVAGIDQIDLVNPGDSVSFSFDFRARFAPPMSDRRFRFGIHHDGGTPASESDNDLTDDDVGYMVQMDTGSGAEPQDTGDDDVATIRGDLPNGLFSGSTRSTGATATVTVEEPGNAAFELGDTNTRRLELRVTRRFDEALGFDVNDLELYVDGVLAASGTDDETRSTPVVPEIPVTFSFNQIGIGTNSLANLDYNIDNVAVVFTPASSDSTNFDGFEDGDRDNDSVAEGPVNDASDEGFAFYKSRGSSSFDVAVIDDASGIGTGNALSILPTTTSTRAVSAAFDDITLNQVGDFIRLKFDARVLGVIPTADRRFRWGLHDSAGTPVTQDGGTTMTSDDAGYHVQIDTGPGASTTATIRGEVDPGSFLGGSTRSFGANSSDVNVAFDDNDTHSLELVIERVFDLGLGAETVQATFLFDAVEATSAVDDDTRDPPLNPNIPITFNFNQVSFGTNGVSNLNMLIDNVEITTNVVPCAFDLTGDGVADIFDVAAYLNLAEAMDAAADLDNDTDVDADDVGAFLSGVASGCP
ncbi:MAG: hypothetical protein AAGB34_03615 [Planctomycetota bacterium]